MVLTLLKKEFERNKLQKKIGEEVNPHFHFVSAGTSLLHCALKFIYWVSVRIDGQDITLIYFQIRFQTRQNNYIIEEKIS